MMEGQRIGSYRVVRRLGAGGMGVVYEAVHEHITSRRAAIKVLDLKLVNNAELVARFLNEAHAVNLISHPSIVSITEIGQLESGAPYIVMELLEGEPLSALLRHHQGRLAVGQAIRLVRQLAAALCAVHERGIVHRDLKPDNIMIVPDPEAAGGYRPKLLDFGIAKMAPETADSETRYKTRTGTIMGTPVYMSPEQCRGAGGVDERSDVYSLGVIFYEALVGKPPFNAKAPGEILAMHLYLPTPLLLDVAPGAPPRLSALLQAMLAKAPSERPSMIDVLARLSDMGSASANLGRLDISGTGREELPPEVADAMTAAYGVPGSSSLHRRRRKRRLVLGGALGLGLLGAGLFGGALWLRARGGRPAAVQAAAVAPTAVAPTAVEEAFACEVTSAPAVARVMDRSGEVFLGLTPWSTRRARGQGALEVLLRCEGFADQPLRLEPGPGCSRQVTLVALPPREDLAAPVPRKRREHHAPAPSEPVATPTPPVPTPGPVAAPAPLPTPEVKKPPMDIPVWR